MILLDNIQSYFNLSILESFSIMTNFLIDNCKKLVIPAYLATQLLVALAVRNIHVNPYPHLALLIAASIAYLIVALKDV